MTNKEVLAEFYEKVFNAWDVSNLDKYMHDDYRQHNPTVEDGKAGFIRFTERFFQLKPHMEIVHMVGDGDMVVVFFKVTFKDGSVAKVFDMYRLRDGKLAEHWDSVQHLDTSPEVGDLDRNFY